MRSDAAAVGSEAMEPRFDHGAAEGPIYEEWERSGYFNPDKLPKRKGAKNAKPFTIIMPPPNANGSLHLGHAVFVTLQDIMIRYARMQGRKALWLPGADHAGFETWVVFDKKLEKEGRNRIEIDRDTLWKEIYDFTQNNKVIMESQLRKLGASCDWSREKFTLEPDVIKTVYDTFELLHKDGLAYRDLRVVNWCPKHRTALSDLEVKYVEREDPLYYIKYGPLTLATVRPETKFGDTGLAVNPNDKRYKQYIGKEIEARGVLGAVKFKVIGDDAVDPKFGTGVVKITPAHDALDFEIWQRHKDEIPGPKIVIDESGRLTGDVGEYKGMKVAEARAKVAEKMQEIGILEKVDAAYTHQVATCYKCNSTLEPLPKQQWFVKIKPLAEKAIKAAEQKKIVFHPDRSKKVYFHWLKNIRDWNISRQIIWGIRIPAWYLRPARPISIAYFVHGTTTDNERHIATGQNQGELSDLGKRQNENLKKLIENDHFDLVVSSDLKRAFETAKAVFPDTKIVADKRLRECDYGNLNGKPESKFKSQTSYISNAHPGGESLKDVEARIRNLLEEIVIQCPGKRIALVAHRAPQLALEVVLNKKTWEEAIEEDWRLKKAWQPGWQYQLNELISTTPKDNYEQDPDVFDTWFSSGQWPFAALGYPDSKDYKTYYPTDVMETGYDILFFWVTRMMMLGLYRTGKVPFKHVYLHGLVRDKDRQKMSKSKGNVIDPLGVAELYGADALRMALTVGNTAGNDIIISEDKVRGYRNFTTKVWNIARFIKTRELKGAMKPKVTAEDKKYLKEFEKIKTRVARHIEKFEFHLAAEKAYHYIWHTFADKIIERYKVKSGADTREVAGARQTMEKIFLESMKMLHPFMPFVTEAVWQKFRPGTMLMVERW